MQIQKNMFYNYQNMVNYQTNLQKKKETVQQMDISNSIQQQAKQQQDKYLNNKEKEIQQQTYSAAQIRNPQVQQQLIIQNSQNLLDIYA